MSRRGSPALRRGRKAKAASATHAVVVRFSRSRKRYERKGLLVEPAALRAAHEALGLEPPRP